MPRPPPFIALRPRDAFVHDGFDVLHGQLAYALCLSEPVHHLNVQQVARFFDDADSQDPCTHVHSIPGP